MSFFGEIDNATREALGQLVSKSTPYGSGPFGPFIPSPGPTPMPVPPPPTPAPPVPAPVSPPKSGKTLMFLVVGAVAVGVFLMVNKK
jgi:hypothetical protein